MRRSYLKTWKLAEQVEGMPKSQKGIAENQGITVEVIEEAIGKAIAKILKGKAPDYEDPFGPGPISHAEKTWWDSNQNRKQERGNEGAQQGQGSDEATSLDLMEITTKENEKRNKENKQGPITIREAILAWNEKKYSKKEKQAQQTEGTQGSDEATSPQQQKLGEGDTNPEEKDKEDKEEQNVQQMQTAKAEFMKMDTQDMRLKQEQETEVQQQQQREGKEIVIAKVNTERLIKKYKPKFGNTYYVEMPEDSDEDNDGRQEHMQMETDERSARGVATRGIRIVYAASKDGARQKMSGHKSLQPVQKYRV
ncbi:hypothetical protein PIB30_063380 [Stylosanthes scabra]|uniref:Uncharacterized protein n=1 Tax=Stylosanthes scabra TaxID=79078 RepID=A0ABU6WJR7_9FABA|nr:hypothetical protein [Stylosanthes scabra]